MISKKGEGHLEHVWGHPHDCTPPSSLCLSSQQGSLCLTPASAPR